jgi:serine protease Do
MKTQTPFATALVLGLALSAGLAGNPESTLAAPDIASPPRKESSGLRMLEELQTVITDLAEEAKPSVVSIFPIQTLGKSRDGSGERVPNSTGSGSGVIIDPNGHIITNNHVVGDATEVEVRLSDKTKLFAQVVGKDPDTDLAVLKVTTDHPLPAARFGDSTGVKVGQWVLAVGNPFGLDRTVTLGVVSGDWTGKHQSLPVRKLHPDRRLHQSRELRRTALQSAGRCHRHQYGHHQLCQGIGFAIPSNMAKQVMNQLISKGKVVRAWLGVGLQPLTPDLANKFGVDENEGVLVNEVFERDPAALAGIKPGDVITKVDGALVDTPNKLSRLVAALDPGSSTRVEVVRDGKRLTLNVALSERRDAVVTASLPQSRTDLKLGIDVQDLTAGLAEKFRLNESRGVLISKVEAGSLAQAEGLREGDLVKEVNRVDTGTVGEFTVAVSKVKRGDTILLRVLREGRAFYVVLKPADR